MTDADWQARFMHLQKRKAGGGSGSESGGFLLGNMR